MRMGQGLGKQPDAADDYDIWITVGQTLHELDESLLEVWDEWSKTSDKYKDGECHKRWLSFSKGGGRTIGSLIHIAKEQGWEPSQDHKVLSVDDDLLENTLQLIADQDEELMGVTILPLDQQRDEPLATDNIRIQRGSSSSH